MSLYPWQQADWQHLHSYIVQQRIPQALLITGNKGLGKQQLAEQFAYALLCEQPQTDGLACGHCHSCALLKAQTHPDFMAVQPEEDGKTITIGQIRTLISKLTLKPQFDRYRVVILNPAQQMNNAAANAFLKCLEEPNERTVIILISDRPTKLPATIVSRCQKLAIATPDKASVLTWLKQQGCHDHADVLLSLAQGAPLLALHYGQEQHLKLRNDCFKAWLAIAARRSHPVIVAEDWQKHPETALLFWLSSWLIDLIRLNLAPQSNNSLYNPDLRDSLQGLARQLDAQGLYALYDLLLISRQRLDTQLNKQLLFEEILLHWAALNRSHHNGRSS